MPLFQIKKQHWSLLLFFCGMTTVLAFNNCSNQFKTLEAGSSDSSSLNGGDNGGFRTPTPSPSPSGTGSPTPTLAPQQAVRCDESQHQFPIATHWHQASNNIVEGAFDQITISNPQGPIQNKVYNYGFLPEYEKYIGDQFSISAWSSAAAEAWASSLCSAIGIAVEFRKPSSYKNWAAAKQAATAKRNSMQIIASLISSTNKSMISVVLPPGWDPSAPAGTYPILFNGAYDVKDNLESEGTQMIRAQAHAWKTSQEKIIGVTWNGGGAMASRTVNEGSFAEFNTVIQAVATHFGADPQRIMTFGGSRGGVTSLRVAANPLGFPYKVQVAYAAVPPAQIGFIASLANATVPLLIHAGEWTTGINNCWKSGWTYPNFGNSLTGLSCPEAHLKILTGSSDATWIDNNVSLSSGRLLTALKNSGARIYLEIGSHDFIVPWADQFRYAKLLDQNQVPHELRINYMAGHWRHNGDLQNLLDDSALKMAKRQYGAIFQMGRKSYFRVDAQTQTTQPVAGPLFTLEVPRYMSPSIGGHLIATGSVGTKIKIAGTSNSQELPTFELNGEISSDGTWMMDLATIGAAVYRINSVQIQKPGAGWQTLSMSRLSTRYQAGSLVLEKLASDVEMSAGEITATLVSGYLGTNKEFVNGPEFFGVSYGVCE